MKLFTAFAALTLLSSTLTVAQTTVPMPNPLRPEERSTTPPESGQTPAPEQRADRDDEDDMSRDMEDGEKMWNKSGARKGAHFKFMREDGEIDIKCSPTEATAACVDGAIRLMDKLRQVKDAEKR